MTAGKYYNLNYAMRKGTMRLSSRGKFKATSENCFLMIWAADFGPN